MASPSMHLTALLTAFLVSNAPQSLDGSQEGGLDRATERVIARSVEALLAKEERGDSGEWPYESAYRVQGEIPIGYRVGGTGWVLCALARAPGLRADAKRQAAIARGLRFLCASLDHEYMAAEIPPGFDMRLWGYLAALRGLLDTRRLGAVPAELEAEVDRAVTVYLERVFALEIPRTGGWSYHRPGGERLPAPAYSYVTALALLDLFEAKRQGFAIDEEAVERALDVVHAQRQPSGAFVYKGVVPATDDPPSIPGSVGRMVCCETTLFLAGRSSLVHVRGALDAFLAHHHWLDERRGRSGLHKPPHAIAPHYFYFAHQFAAEAIELLPEADRAEYRARLAALLAAARGEDGLWNDRVFPRSASYGTAVAILAYLRPTGPPLAVWNGSD